LYPNMSKTAFIDKILVRQQGSMRDFFYAICILIGKATQTKIFMVRMIFSVLVYVSGNIILIEHRTTSALHFVGWVFQGKILIHRFYVY
jgi:hypothetical protein